MSRVQLKSPDNGSLLTFEIRARHNEEIVFDVAVKTPWFFGCASSSTFMVGTPAELFREMADEWSGWNGEKNWSDLERSITIVATCDHTGHISLWISLQGQDGDSHLRVRLNFEAGQLETMANEITDLFR